MENNENIFNEPNLIEYLYISPLRFVNNYIGPIIDNPKITIMKTKKEVLVSNKIPIGHNTIKKPIMLLKRKMVYQKMSEMYLDKEENIYEKCTNRSSTKGFELNLRIRVGQRSIFNKLVEEEEFFDDVENEAKAEIEIEKNDNTITQSFSNLQITEMENTKIYG
jgi:hypothetical protein